MNSLIKRDIAAEQGFDAHRDGHLGGSQQTPGIYDGQGAACFHDMGAVDECQALFGLQDYRLQTSTPQGLTARQPLTLVPGFTLTYKDETEMSEGRQVTTCAMGISGVTP
jgi:hypothetical protein